MPLSRRLLTAGTVGLVGLIFLVHRPHNSFLHDNHEHQQRGLRGMRRLEEVTRVTPEPAKSTEGDKQFGDIDFVVREAEHLDRQISGMLPGGGHSGPV